MMTATVRIYFSTESVEEANEVLQKVVTQLEWVDFVEDAYIDEGPAEERE